MQDLKTAGDPNIILHIDRCAQREQAVRLHGVENAECTEDGPMFVKELIGRVVQL